MEPGVDGKDKQNKDAIVEAEKDWPSLVMWTDGSKLDQGAGAAVCWRRRSFDPWKEKGIFLGKNKEILDAELWAILTALNVALKETLNAKDASVTIFSGSQRALRVVGNPLPYRENSFLRSCIYEKAGELERNGHPVILRWIPGHSGLAGNEKADQVAKRKAERGGRQAERWSSLAHIQKNLINAQSQELIKWQEAKTLEREHSRRGYYTPWTREGINSTLANASKKYASRYFQLKVGHGAIGTFLAKIRAIETPECWWCREPDQSVGHLYTRCRKWRKARRKLVRELEKEGVRWQAQAERKWLADLLANEKAVAPLLKFLEATGVGGREGARERELEWERRDDQAGVDLLE